MADLGWITGHTSVVYGPLCNGVTTVLFESVASYPDCGMYILSVMLKPYTLECKSDNAYLKFHSLPCVLPERYWEMIDRVKITHLYTIPTVMKFLMKVGDEHVDKYTLSSLKVLALGNPM